MPIQTIIVDDEKPAREELAYLLNGFPEISLIGTAQNGLEAVNLIREHAPDLVFLDVQMPGLDGFGVLQKLVERKLKVPHVVFATAFDHYAVQAFDVNAVDYVLKPFDKARISKAIQKAKKEIEAHTSPTERLEQLVSQLSAPKPARNPPQSSSAPSTACFSLMPKTSSSPPSKAASSPSPPRSSKAPPTTAPSRNFTLRSTPTLSGAPTAPISSTFTTSRKWCPGSSPASCSK